MAPLPGRGVPHEDYQCQPWHENYSELNPCNDSNSYGFDQPPQNPIDQSPLQEMSIQDMEDLKQHYLDEMLSLSNQIQIKDYRNEKIDIHFRRECESMIDEIKGKFNGMSIEINKKKELQHLEQVANLSTYPSQRFKSFCYDDYDYEESTIPLNEILSQIPLSIAIIPVLPTLELEDSLIMGNEELSTILEKGSDEFIKSSVEDLVPIPSESKDSSESEDDEPSEMIKDQKSTHHSSGNPTPSFDFVVASFSPFLTPTRDSDYIVEETDTLLPHHDSTSPEVDEDILRYPARNFEIDSLIKGPPDTFLIGDEDIKLNPPMDVGNLVLIPMVSEKPLDLVLEIFKTTITDPLFDFDSEITFDSDNPILDIQNKESDELKMETIMKEVQIYSTQSTVQIPSLIAQDCEDSHARGLVNSDTILCEVSKAWSPKPVSVGMFESLDIILCEVSKAWSPKSVSAGMCREEDHYMGQSYLKNHNSRSEMRSLERVPDIDKKTKTKPKRTKPSTELERA
ncbi:hypothetical protein Tco_0355697 [Tanacetum coccineum]